MEIGKLKHRLTIQSATETKDALGQVTRTWSDIASRWGQITPLQGRELERARQLANDVTHKVILRYYAGLSTLHRFKFETSRFLNISVVVNTDEHDEEMTVLATEKTLPVTSSVLATPILSVVQTEGIITLSWTAISNKVSYYLAKHTTGDIWDTYQSVDSNSLAISGLVVGNTYNYKVKALGDNVNYTDSNYSNVASITVAEFE